MDATAFAAWLKRAIRVDCTEAVSVAEVGGACGGVMDGGLGWLLESAAAATTLSGSDTDRSYFSSYSHSSNCRRAANMTGITQAGDILSEQIWTMIGTFR